MCGILVTIVNEIDWSSSLLKIKTNQGTISSKKCIVTVSTNVLANEILKFTPMLPLEKYEAFSNIKLGFYNHILIQFTDSFYKNFNIKKDTYLKTNGFNKDNKITWDSELFLDIGLNGSSNFSPGKKMNMIGQRPFFQFVLIFC